MSFSIPSLPISRAHILGLYRDGLESVVRNVVSTGNEIIGKYPAFRFFCNTTIITTAIPAALFAGGFVLSVSSFAV